MTTTTPEEVLRPLTLALATLMLLVMIAANIALAFVGLHGWNAALSLAMAAVEVVIMAQVFMRLRWSPPVIRLVGIASLLWLGILLLGTLDDILTRGWLPIPGK